MNFPRPGLSISAPSALGATSCKSPCSLRFNRDAKAEVDVSGDMAYHTTITVPANGGDFILKPDTGRKVMALVFAPIFTIAAAGTFLLVANDSNLSEQVGLGVLGGLESIVAISFWTSLGKTEWTLEVKPASSTTSSNVEARESRKRPGFLVVPTVAPTGDGGWAMSLVGRF